MTNHIVRRANKQVNDQWCLQAATWWWLQANHINLTGNRLLHYFSSRTRLCKALWQIAGTPSRDPHYILKSPITSGYSALWVPLFNVIVQHNTGVPGCLSTNILDFRVQYSAPSVWFCHLKKPSCVPILVLFLYSIIKRKTPSILRNAHYVNDKKRSSCSHAQVLAGN